MLITIDLTDEQLAALSVAESQKPYAGKQPLANNPSVVADYLTHLKGLKQEHAIVVTLNSRGRIIHRHVLSKGTLDGTLVHPRELFRLAIADNAAKVIVAHNHPSGECAPSDEDITATKRLVTAGKLIGIPIVDHLIIASDGYYSLQEHGHI